MTESHITDEEYQHAENVWNTFKCDDLGDYTDVYLVTDILLLADIFEVGKTFFLKIYIFENNYAIFRNSERPVS